MREITVEAKFEGVLPTGSYANMRPGFMARETFQVDDSIAKEVRDDMISCRHQELQAICFENFQMEANKAKVMKIKEDLKGFRFYQVDGEDYPGVTSILGYDSTVSEEDLKQYSAQGTINHARVADYIKTGVWKAPKEIEGIGAELFILKQGGLQLDSDACDFPAFLKKYPIEKLENGQVLVNRTHKYAGTNDGLGVYNGLRTLFDVKRTPDKVKNFMQMSAYANCLEGIEQLMIIPLNDSTEQKFSKPIVTAEVSKYFDMFLWKRKEFRKVYGI